MNINPARPQTPEEIDAGFAKIFANLVPADLHQPSLRELLEPYRAHIVLKRKQGYSLKQITEALQLDPFAIKVSTVTLLKFLHGKTKRRAAKLTAMPAVKPVLPQEIPAPIATPKPSLPLSATGAKPSLPLRSQGRPQIG